MDTQQLYETIEQQNQVIIAKNATIDNLQKKLRDANSELQGLYLDRSYQKLHRQWVTETMRQKSVHVVGGFEYNTRYVPLHLVVVCILVTIMFTFFIVRQMFL